MQTGEAETTGKEGCRQAVILQDARAFPWYTPPTEPYEVRQVSWLAGRHHFACLPGIEMPVTFSAKRLAAYSCGAAPDFPHMERNRIPS